MSDFHLVGVGGAGMSVVAELLLARGYEVSGSDQADSVSLRRLESLGVHTFVGHAAAQVPAGSTVVVSTAVRETNPELAFARKQGLPVMHRSEALALAANGMEFIAVAGAHGKTTTSGMLAAAFSALGADPSFAVGSTVAGFGTGAHLGAGPFFIAEADESDRSFLNYSPRVALVTNVEPDHLDHYGSREAFEEAFDLFAQRIIPEGALVVCADDPGALALGNRVLAAGKRVLAYGRFAELAGAQQVQIKNVQIFPEGAAFTLTYDAVDYPVELRVSGEHNVLNAAGAFAVAVELGLDPAEVACALQAFSGTGRRFEFKAEVGGRRLFDDYAHHPTEVATTLHQAKIMAGSGKVTVLFQPHLYSRTVNFQRDFATALEIADRVVLADIYGARENPVPGVSSEVISQHISREVYVGDLQSASQVAADLTGKGDICLTMGAGDVFKAAEIIVAKWQETV